jgi:hypothetical protein
LPFAVICYYLATGSQSRGLRAYLIGSLVATMALMATTSNTASEGASHHEHLYQLFAKQAQVYGAFVIAYLVMLAALVVLLRHPVNTASSTASQLSRAA